MPPRKLAQRACKRAPGFVIQEEAADEEESEFVVQNVTSEDESRSSSEDDRPRSKRIKREGKALKKNYCSKENTVGRLGIKMFSAQCRLNREFLEMELSDLQRHLWNVQSSGWNREKAKKASRPSAKKIAVSSEEVVVKKAAFAPPNSKPLSSDMDDEIARLLGVEKKTDSEEAPLLADTALDPSAFSELTLDPLAANKSSSSKRHLLVQLYKDKDNEATPLFSALPLKTAQQQGALSLKIFRNGTLSLSGKFERTKEDAGMRQMRLDAKLSEEKIGITAAMAENELELEDLENDLCDMGGRAKLCLKKVARLAKVKLGLPKLKIKDFQVSTVWGGLKLAWKLDLAQVASYYQRREKDSASERVHYNAELFNGRLRIDNFLSRTGLTITAFKTGQIGLFSNNAENLIAATRTVTREWKRFEPYA